MRSLISIVTTLTITTVLSENEVYSEEDMLLTPIGYWPAKCIHGVNAGSHITNLDEKRFMIEDSISHEKMIKYRCDRNYLHKMKALHKKKQLLENKGYGLVDGDGWQQYTKQESGDTTTGLLGQWTVPIEPSQGDGTLFTFTGLQNIDWVPPSPEPSDQFDIIQPVLQYGKSAAGGGNYWTIASWYVTLGLDVVYSKLQEVKAGVTIFGNMTKTGDEEWYINAVDDSTNVNSDITVSKSRLSTQPWSYVTLEVYSVYSCDQYPTQGTPIPYTQLKLYLNNAETDPTWEIGTDGQNPPICNSNITIVDPNTVTIRF